MSVFSVLTIKRKAAKSVFLTFFILSLFSVGCNDENHTTNKATAIFTTFSTPSTTEDVEARLSNLTVRVEEVRSQIITSESSEWDHNLIVLYDLFMELNDATNYNIELMNKSPDTAVRTLAYAGYQQYPQLTEILATDNNLTAIVKNALNNFNPSTEREQEITDYLSSIFNSDYSTEEQNAINEINEKLTATSLEYYNNAVTKSATAMFTPEEFGCLSEDILSKLSTDVSGNYILDATTPFFFTLLESCLDETVREKVDALYNSKAAAENSILWPTIMEDRLTYAQSFGFEDFASARLSNSMLKDVENVKDLLNNVETITAPAFERLQQRYKDLQESEYGIMPDRVFNWNRLRYSSDVKMQIYNTAIVNPHVFTFPETFDRMLYLIGKIFSLNFVKKGNLENSWNPDVIKYLVYDLKTDTPIGTLLLDPYHIDGTVGVANALSMISSRLLDSGERQQPVVILNANISKSTTGTTYISSYQYQTFAHELGHALHFLLKAPASTYKTDFTEIPSIFTQSLLSDPAFFKALLSPNPDEPLEQLSDEFISYWNYNRESAVTICEGERYALTLSATSIDAAKWQGNGTTILADIAKSNFNKYYYPYSNDSQPSYTTIHFIVPSTDAKYYMYVLAHVVAKDMLSLFKASPESIFDQQLGYRYRYEILENSAPDSEASISNFLGREWNYDAYKQWFKEKTDAL